MSSLTAFRLAIGSALALTGGAYAHDLLEEQQQAVRTAIGSEKCPPTTDPDEIVVCARRDDERYRLPPSPPAPGTKQALSVSQERRRLYDYDFGGIGSCSAIGPGGVSGCLKRKLDSSRN